MTNSFDFQSPQYQGLIFNKCAALANKLVRFAHAGGGHTFYLFDFDRTLTSSKQTGDNTTTWEIMHALLPLEGQKVNNAIRDKYLALESAGTLSMRESRAWPAIQINLHKKHGTKMNAIRLAAKQIQLRDGSRNLFAACDAAGIPTVILSAGIRDIIELIVTEHGIHPSELLSIKLQFDNAGRVIGWDKDSMVLTRNKHETVKQRLSHITAQRPYVVLVGDTLEDARMVDGGDTILRVRVWDEQENKLDDGYIRQSFDAGYDIIATEDFVPLTNLTKWLSDAHE